MANYPEILDNFTPKVDDADDVMATDVNDLQTAIVALQTKVGVDNSIVETTIEHKVAAKENSSNKVTSFQVTPDDTHYPSAKLVYDQLALKTENPMINAGDIIYGGEAGFPTALPKGTDGQLLTLASGLPEWVDPSGSVPEAGVAVSDGSDWGASLQVIDPDNPVAQSAGYLTGGTGHSDLSVFQALGAGANNAKIKINVDGTVYDNVAIDLKPFETVGSSKILQSTTSFEEQFYASGKTGGQTFTVPAGVTKLTKFRFSTRLQGSGGAVAPTFEVRLVNPTGTVVQTGIAFTSPSGNWREFSLTSPLSVTPGDVIYIGMICNTNDGNNYHAIQHTGNVYAGGSYWLNGVAQSGDIAFEVYGLGNVVVADMNAVATQVQLGIRAVTSKTETCVYSTNKMIITSSVLGRLSQILKLMSPTTGTDISGAGAIPYLDCAGNATETFGNGEDGKLVKLDKNGKMPTPYSYPNSFPLTLVSNGFPSAFSDNISFMTQTSYQSGYGGVTLLRNGFDLQLNAFYNPVNQYVSATTLAGGGSTNVPRGALIIGDYIYVALRSNVTGSDIFYMKRALLSSNITLLANWQSININGSALPTNAQLAGYGNNRFWIQESGGVFTPFILTGTTLEREASVNIVGAPFSERSFVNSSGIYYYSTSAPYFRKVDFNGEATSVQFGDTAGMCVTSLADKVYIGKVWSGGGVMILTDY